MMRLALIAVVLALLVVAYYFAFQAVWLTAPPCCGRPVDSTPWLLRSL